MAGGRLLLREARTSIDGVSAQLESARRDWEEGHRRLVAAARDAASREQLHRQVEAVTDELRKRVGATFTLAELARAYARSEDWAREAIAERAATPGWLRNVSVVSDAAFHLYARGALDYNP